MRFRFISIHSQFGQLCIGSNDASSSIPMLIPLDNVVDIAAGYHHTILLNGQGSIYTCGLNNVRPHFQN
jgi:alpha-tubulin suppressor-like RCC1 family protein